jgi:hypothetical protein
VLLADADRADAHRLAAPADIAERRPGRLAAVVELVRAKTALRDRV